MANPDRPSGFKPVGTMIGAPWNSVVRKLGVVDGTDIYRYDPLTLSSNLATAAATSNLILGVAVGFGRNPSGVHNDGQAMPFDPSKLETRWYDDSANTHTEWVVYYVPAELGIFEVQSASDLDAAVGDALDFVYAAGDATTGVSAAEATTKSNDDLNVVAIPNYPDNDSTLTNTRYHVIFDAPTFLAVSPVT